MADLDLLTELVNTADLLSGKDQLATPAGTKAWLLERGLLDGSTEVREGERARLVALREALRSLAQRHTGAAADPEAERVFAEEAGRAPLRVRLVGDGADLVPNGSGFDAVIGSMVGAVYAAALDGSWRRFKACMNDECAWAYRDVSKNRSRRWCEMASCGNMMNARSYRARKRHQE